MTDYLPNLLLALGIFSLGFVSIGPNILAIIGTSMALGRRQGAALATGVGLGSGIWAALTVLGFAKLMTTYAGALVVLKLFGAAYLLWLAFGAFRAAAQPSKDLTVRQIEGGQMLRRGLTIQMTNPKAALHWIAIVTLGLGADAPLSVGIALVISATALSLIGHLAYALTFSTRPVVAFYADARRWIEAGLGIFFMFAAVKLATART